MSTKALREVLYWARSCDFDRETMVAAKAELEAIEWAAHMVAVIGQSEAAADRYPEWKAACELLRSIAKDRP